MKKHIASFVQIIVALSGGIAVSQAISFGWFSEGKRVDIVLNNHAVILFAAGAGLLAASYFIRHSSMRIAALEQRLSELQTNKG